MEGYIAIVLSKKDQTALQEFAYLPKIFAHHMTVAFEPDHKTLLKYRPRFGERVILKIKAEVRGRKGQALIVQGFESENTFPHITISCAEDKSPVFSNEVCRRCKRRPFVIKEVSGSLRFVKRKKR